MNICPNCKNEVLEGDKKCDICGISLEAKPVHEGVQQAVEQTAEYQEEPIVPLTKEEKTRRRLWWWVSVAILGAGFTSTVLGKMLAGFGLLIIAMMANPMVVPALLPKLPFLGSKKTKLVIAIICAVISILDLCFNLYGIFPSAEVITP